MLSGAVRGTRGPERFPRIGGRHTRRDRATPSWVDVGCHSGNRAAWRGLPRHQSCDLAGRDGSDSIRG